MGAPAWEVLYYDLGDDEDALTELIAKASLGDKQIARINKAFERLEQHGPALDGDYFDSVQGSSERLREFRITADKVEIRFLFVLRKNCFVMLKGYKKKRKSDVRHLVPTAEQRLAEWDRKNEKS